MPEADTAVGMFKKDEEKLKKKTLQNVTHIQNQSTGLKLRYNSV